MSTRIVTCHILVCDECKQDFEHDYTPHYPEIDEARDDARDSDWVNDEQETVLCAECSRKPHPFRLKPNTTDECWRCPNPADEHESETKMNPYELPPEIVEMLNGIEMQAIDMRFRFRYPPGAIIGIALPSGPRAELIAALRRPDEDDNEPAEARLRQWCKVRELAIEEPPV